MGYILPVNRTQSADYHEREVKKKRQDVKTYPVFKTVLDKNHEELKSNHNRLHPHSSVRTKKDDQTDSDIDKKVMSEVTGNGQQLNVKA